ncbi:MAG: zinc-ribbon domain-containing protein [Sandaracinaceae bacterium]|nr:zinc-ribbon domain-containing protein [Sandaracinaceae bacterium]
MKLDVACPTCSSPYSLDRARLPAAGLMMRCPKCSARFKVFTDGTVALADALPPAKPVPKPTLAEHELDLPAPKTPRTGAAAPAPPARPAEIELDLPALKPPSPAAGAAARKPLASPLAGAGPAAKKPLAPPVSATRPTPGEMEIDLPAAKAPPKRAPSFGELDLDLPPSAGALDVDLPAPKTPPRRAEPAALPAKAAPTKANPLAARALADDVDLPAAKPAAPKAPLGARPLAGKPAPAAAAPAPEVDLPALRAPAPAARAKLAPPLDSLSGPGAPPVPRKAPTASALDELDLPAPKTPIGGKLGATFGELDLPAPKTPAKPGKARKDSGPDFDLPVAAPVLDLPGLKAANPSSDLGELDLPAPKTPPQRARGPEANDLGGLDLPAPKAKADVPDFGELDLPSLKGASDLPAPKAARRDSFGELDLNRPPRRESADLDLPAPQADLPRVKKPTPPPALGGQGSPFDDLDDEGLDLPAPASDLPALKSDFGELDLPALQGASDLPVPKSDLRSPSQDFGDIALPDPRRAAPAAALDDDDELALPEPAAPLAQAAPAPGSPLRDTQGRGGVGGTAFGELDLDAGSPGLPGGGGGEDMEFADLPSGEARGDSLPPPRAAIQKKERKAPAAAEGAPARPRWPIVVGVVVLLLAAGGVGMGFTPYGWFGMKLAEDFMPGAGDPAQVQSVIRRAEESARSDAWTDVFAARVALGRARRDSGLNRALLSRSLVHEALFQVRFGESDRVRTAAIRHRLDERGAEGPEVALGLAADALREGQHTRARSLIGRARSFAPRDPYVALIEGELALATGELEPAGAAFARAVELGAGARGLWGSARVALRGEDREAARRAVDAVLAESPTHGAALVAKASLLLDAGEIDAALEAGGQAAGRRPVGDTTIRSAPSERAGAWTVIGRANEARGRSTLALSAFDRALEADDRHIPALLGAGRMLLADRPAEALARFESALSAEGAQALAMESGRSAADEAQLGAARAMLALGRAQEAKTRLEQLAVSRENDPDVLLWLGNAEVALEPPAREAAEQHFRTAIQHAPTRFAPYLALAELFLASERGTDAGAVLEQASARVPETPETRFELGRFELRRNNHAPAIRELTRALELDPEHPGALFSLGVAQRRSGQLAEAGQTFDRLSGLDASHPGLALERGILFEAQGLSQQAVESYRAALAEQPNDVDLLLRLGAAQVAAGSIDEAEQTLEQVRRDRPNSAEAQHFVGRVAFARGRYADALAHFRDAVRLDPARGEFHLYVGWAALENGLLGDALTAVQTAIERDPSLADAYWIRGTVKLRSGRPAEALDDLRRALTLKPSRVEAHAAMGEAYDQLGRLGDAILEYEQAVGVVDDNGQWWYRLGRLRMDRGDRQQAAQALARATLLGEAQPTRPGWLADAHRIQADAHRLGGQRAEAVQHYRRYLELAPPSAIDRRDVRETLLSMGEVPPPD